MKKLNLRPFSLCNLARHCCLCPLKGTLVCEDIKDPVVPCIKGVFDMVYFPLWS
jgi:hypothetical protein